MHLSGIAFVFLARFTGSILTSLYFIMIAVSFLVYSWFVKREEKMLKNFIHRFETRLRNIALGMERNGISRPFIGAFWFYFSCGLTFLIFPLTIASAACAVLTVGDALSTLVGKKYGKHKIIGKKTMEGSLAFFTGSFFISLVFISPCLALIGAGAGALIELIPEISPLKKFSRKGTLDDNLLIPLLTGLVIYAIHVAYFPDMGIIPLFYCH